MKTAATQISVVIVNYNVKEYLEQALISIRRALHRITHEIIVVDNASVDGSVPYIRRRFPDVELIESPENLGFGRANNLALQKVKGEFVVLINPDTVVQEDTFIKLLEFFEKYPDASAATCKIINPDGSFSVDCRHSIPTPLIAFWKVIGFSKLFPRSRIFGKYNLTYLDPDQIYAVPAISGSFMMIKKQVLDTVGFFDEQFFMYCEDIDLCHRINQAGFKIYYVPTTQIIHYKGESTKKNKLDYHITFNKALYQFFKKNYAHRYIFLFRWIIILGLVMRGAFIFIKNFLHNHFPLLLDLFILNLVIMLSFILRMELKSGFHWENYIQQYWTINLISSILFLAVSFYLEVYPKHRLSVQSIIKANIITFVLLASITFFLKQFAFSRMVVSFAAIASPLVMIGWRSLMKRYYKGEKSAWGKDIFSKPTAIVGNGAAAIELYNKIRSLKDLSYDLAGVIVQNGMQATMENQKIPVLGNLKNVRELIRLHNIRQIIFSTENLSFEQILKTITAIGNSQIDYKLVPSNLDVMIGKSFIERMEDYPLLDIEYAVGKTFNRTVKRIMDISIAAIFLFITVPVVLPLLLINAARLQKVEIAGPKGEPIKILQVGKFSTKSFLNRWLLVYEILRGKISIIGSPIATYSGNNEKDIYWYKPGITGLVQINRNKIMVQEDMEKYHLFYLKNQSLLLDMEILTKAIFSRLLFKSK